MRMTMFLDTSHVRKRTRKLRLIQQDSFPRMYYEGDISVRLKRTPSHFYQCRSGQHQGISWKGTFQANFRIKFYKP